MNLMRPIRSTAGAAFVLGLSAAPSFAFTNAIYDDRPILVRPAPHHGWPGDCPTCYKGHDFGHDCFQNVWNGFESVWTNVCIWGWQ